MSWPPDLNSLGHNQPPGYQDSQGTAAISAAEMGASPANLLWRHVSETRPIALLLDQVGTQLHKNREAHRIIGVQMAKLTATTNHVRARIEQELALLRTEMTKYREQSNRLALISAQNMICGARLDVRRQVILAVWFLGCLLLAWKRAAQEIEE
ncbi:hypothetical protein SISNIDRAFT_469203 [Sistotremastrum niveocremeum HHB9708]|uniref:Uncharacterized protein n=1 Tax=Sistotremastrum niveocremeum HHB9708 TaxID=1314777 RepID=A0A164QIP5_9AGAM|nr:hypothetical protein SISNIDRAFT_469203 [Sistotremastrum niveocremeum HHB9708]